MPKNSCIMQIWAESGKSALPICNYSQILYQFLTFTQNLKRSHYDIPCVQISVRTEHRDLYVDVAVEGTYHVGGSELDIVTDTIYELTQAGILEVVPEESEGK